MNKPEAVTALQNVIIHLDHAKAHACAGWDCSVCQPAQVRAEIATALDALRQETVSG